LERIEFKEYTSNPEARFSIVIPTWNNLSYVRLCVESIRKNSRYPHQIILHVNEGSDGTLAWAIEQKLDHSSSAKNVGVCYAVNAAATLVKTDYLVYMNDDMYVCPDWDHFLWQEIEALDHSQFFISSTIIEPKETGNRCVIVSDAFGDSIENFSEEALKKQCMDFPKEDWQGGTWPPNIIPKKLWDLVGGGVQRRILSGHVFRSRFFTQALGGRGAPVQRMRSEPGFPFHVQIHRTGLQK